MKVVAQLQDDTTANIPVPQEAECIKNVKEQSICYKNIRTFVQATITKET
jgi:hypothetical protein